jgi:hypothetical protein
MGRALSPPRLINSCSKEEGIVDGKKERCPISTCLVYGKVAWLVRIQFVRHMCKEAREDPQWHSQVNEGRKAWNRRSCNFSCWMSWKGGHYRFRNRSSCFSVRWKCGITVLVCFFFLECFSKGILFCFRKNSEWTRQKPIFSQAWLAIAISSSRRVRLSLTNGLMWSQRAFYGCGYWSDNCC